MTQSRQDQPDAAKTTRPNLTDLANNIHTTKWFELGLQLTDNDARSALLEVLDFVLREDPELSWDKVVLALQTISEVSIAKTIQDKFCKPS